MGLVNSVLLFTVPFTMLKQIDLNLYWSLVTQHMFQDSGWIEDFGWVLLMVVLWRKMESNYP